MHRAVWSKVYYARVKGTSSTFPSSVRATQDHVCAEFRKKFVEYWKSLINSLEKKRKSSCLSSNIGTIREKFFFPSYIYFLSSFSSFFLFFPAPPPLHFPLTPPLSRPLLYVLIFIINVFFLLLLCRLSAVASPTTMTQPSSSTPSVY